MGFVFGVRANSGLAENHSRAVVRRKSSLGPGEFAFPDIIFEIHPVNFNCGLK